MSSLPDFCLLFASYIWATRAFCEYSFYSMLPAGLIGPALSYLLGPDRISHNGFLVWLVEFSQVPLPFLLSSLQYYLIGLLLDKLLEYRSR